MRHLDLFSGIGGFALAARWMNWQTVAFCEIEPYPRAVLEKNFPGVPIHDDIHTLDGRAFRVDIVTGGFPCQPHSTAGLRRGRDDSRHLWPQFARVIKEARPAWVVIENVPGLRTTAADEVLADLESLGYSCWPVVVGAVHAGAPHRRQRVWIVAHADRRRLEEHAQRDGWPQSRLAAPRRHDPERLGADAADARLPEASRRDGTASRQQHGRGWAAWSEPASFGGARDAANAAQLGWREGRAESARIEGRHGAADGGDADAADAIGGDLRDESRRNGCELADRLEPRCAGTAEPGHDGAQGTAADADAAGLEVRRGLGRDAEPQREAAERSRYQPDWRRWTDAPQPAVRAVDDGLPAWVARCRVPALKALGNAIVPQVAFEIFRAIEDASRG